MREEYGAFRGGDPDENHRPDIIIRNPIGTALPVELIDVSIIGTLGGSKHAILQAPATRGAEKVHGGKRAEGALREKVCKYSELVIPGRFSLQPIILNPLAYSIPSLASFSHSVPNTQALFARSPGTGSTHSLSNTSL